LRQYDRLSIDDEPDVAEQGFVQHGVDGGSIV
jgi:hypothetical protein